MFSVRSCLFLFALICTVYGEVDEQYKIIETLNGQIRGIRESTLLNGIPFYSFKGIPYAKPPVNDLRFKSPQPVESWSNVLDAFEHGNTCVQPRKIIPNRLPQSEDCLFLNVYVPAHIEADERLAVLFFIHGGGYSEGASDDYYSGPDFIVEKQTIVVTINYRLGILGFLSLDTPEYSGNMGLKDQQLALKWISSNIDKFGGDNKRITIFGQSAGGSSIHFHILSSESRKHFRNAIPMSGVVGNFWSMSVENDHLKVAHKIATDFGEPNKTYEELVAFLKTAPADKLSKSSTSIVSTGLFDILFAPVIERQDAEQPFLTESPEKIFDTTKIDFDVLFTMTSAEFLGMTKIAPPLEDVLNCKFELPLPFRGLKIPIDDHRNLTNKIREFYFNGSADPFKQYVDLLSDMNFGYAIDKTVKAHAAKSNGKTYYAIFSMDSKLNGFKRRNPNVANVTGTSHCDEMFYLLRHKVAQKLYDEVLNNKEDEASKISLKIIDNITDFFTNFAKYSELSSKNTIPPVQSDSVNFVEINNDGFTTGLNPRKEAFDFLAMIEEQAISIHAMKQRVEV